VSFQKKCLDEAEKILVEAITYQIEMLYLIFASGLTQEAYPSHKPITRIEKTLATQYEYRLDNSAPHQEQ
jgi:hypothetical protein